MKQPLERSEKNARLILNCLDKLAKMHAIRACRGHVYEPKLPKKLQK